MVIFVFLTDPRVAAKVTGHIGLPSSPPPLAHPRLASDPELDFDAFDAGPSDEYERVQGHDPHRVAQAADGRAARPPPTSPTWSTGEPGQYQEHRLWPWFDDSSNH